MQSLNAGRRNRHKVMWEEWALEIFLIIENVIYSNRKCNKNARNMSRNAKDRVKFV